jgi:hypothetical protein
MKSSLVVVAALALCGSAFAATGHGVVSTVKQDAHQIGSSFRHDFHRMARGDKFRQEQAMDQRRGRSRTSAMGAGPADSSRSSGRQARMDAAYANWQRTHR